MKEFVKPVLSGEDQLGIDIAARRKNTISNGSQADQQKPISNGAREVLDAAMKVSAKKDPSKYVRKAMEMFLSEEQITIAQRLGLLHHFYDLESDDDN